MIPFMFTTTLLIALLVAILDTMFYFIRYQGRTSEKVFLSPYGEMFANVIMLDYNRLQLTDSPTGPQYIVAGSLQVDAIYRDYLTIRHLRYNIISRVYTSMSRLFGNDYTGPMYGIYWHGIKINCCFVSWSEMEKFVQAYESLRKPTEAGVL